MVFCVPWDDTYLHYYKIEELEKLPWSRSMYWQQQVKFIKTYLASNFHKPLGEANPYVQFGYFPLTIYNQTQGQASG